MRLSSAHRPVRIVVGFLVAVTATVATLAGPSAPAAAGGWAVGSLDPIPEVTAGETVDVGFTILQHGVRPVDLDEDVGIVIRVADGSAEFFRAVGDGPTGHYVASVTLPEESGSYSWSIRMGWFGPQDLGTLDVRAAEGGGSLWSTGRWGVLAATLVLAGIAVADLLVGRRRSEVTFA